MYDPRDEPPTFNPVEYEDDKRRARGEHVCSKPGAGYGVRYALTEGQEMAARPTKVIAVSLNNDGRQVQMVCLDCEQVMDEWPY